jgi:hypothetical protein
MALGAVKFTTAPAALAASTTWLAGTVTTRAALTVTLKLVEFEMRPSTLVPVQVTGVGPTGKSDPDAGLHVGRVAGLMNPSASVRTGVKVTGVSVAV